MTPHSDAAVKSIAGGFALFLGSESPLTHALGMGMHGPVTAADLDEIESFYRERHSAIILDLCPFADPSLRELLNDRGYRLSDFANVLVRDLKLGPPMPEVQSVSTARTAGPLDMETWSETLVRGFFSRDEITEEERHLGRLLFSIPGGTPFLAEFDEEPAGAAALSMRNGVASLFCDAVLPASRGRGAHAALIRARLEMAMAGGCDLATAGTQPGSTSQLNYQRLGFEVAYTKATMVKE